MDFSSLYQQKMEQIHLSEEKEDEQEECLSTLLSNQLKTHPKLSQTASESYLISRKNAVKWVKKTCFEHKFSSQTLLLAINYLDRCFLSHSLNLQKEKSWMWKLASLASLSLAAKFEEKRVIFIIDLQVKFGEEIGFVFENRTVCRMELLLLSTLGWRMKAVTALSIADCLVCKIKGDLGRKKEVFRSIEIALLAVVDDLEWVHYQPSVWAAAALIYALRSPEKIAGASLEIDILLHLLNVSKESVGGAYQLILEHTGNKNNIKRKHFYEKKCSSFCIYSSLSSPNCVFCSCFNCENSSINGDSLDSSLNKLRPFKKSNTKQITNSGESKELLI